MLAAEWYRKAAEYGDPLGQAALGVATFQGVGVPKNAVEGYIWTKLAAEQGDAKAWSNLSAMVREMTAKELKKARYKVSKFRAKRTRRKLDRLHIERYDTRDSARGRYHSGRSRGGGLYSHVLRNGRAACYGPRRFARTVIVRASRVHDAPFLTTGVEGPRTPDHQAIERSTEDAARNSQHAAVVPFIGRRS